jgi:hypothetical protein
MQPTSRHPIYLLRGPPGSGKSTVAHTVAQQWQQSGQLAASLFFSSENGYLNPTTFCTLLVNHMVQLNPSLEDKLDLLSVDPSLPSPLLQQQFISLTEHLLRLPAKDRSP